MNKNELIVATMFALANGMGKSWVTSYAAKLLVPEHTFDRWHKVKKAARKAVKVAEELNLIDDDKYVNIMIMVFQKNLEIK